MPKASLAGEDDETRYRRQASTGLPLVGVELEIVDDAGQLASLGRLHEGEIVVRSNVVMEGYWNDPDGTATAMRDGWFHTGDVATIDPEGYVLIVDRKKDIIISGGENISSVEIEKVLYECPQVLESAVIAVPDEQWGEVPFALVALRPGATSQPRSSVSFAVNVWPHSRSRRCSNSWTTFPRGEPGRYSRLDCGRSIGRRWRSG